MDSFLFPNILSRIFFIEAPPFSDVLYHTNENDSRVLCWSQLQVYKVGERSNGERGLYFTPKNTKSPPKSRTFVMMCKKQLPICAKPNLIGRKTTSLRSTSFAACRNLIHLCRMNKKWCSRVARNDIDLRSNDVVPSAQMKKSKSSDLDFLGSLNLMTRIKSAWKLRIFIKIYL